MGQRARVRASIRAHLGSFGLIWRGLRAHRARSASKVSSRTERSRSSVAPPPAAVLQKMRVSRSLAARMHSVSATALPRYSHRGRGAPDQHAVHAQPEAQQHIPAGRHHAHLTHTHRAGDSAHLRMRTCMHALVL
jgi:hypothetical protein